MQTIAKKYQAYKRGTIQQLKPFFDAGLVTVSEIERIATKSANDFVQKEFEAEIAWEKFSNEGVK
jgi:hypothetical protein